MLGDHPAWIRVLKVSADGQKTLVAIAWKAKGSKVSAITDDEPKYSDLYYGLPDGTRRWHSIDKFANSQDIDLHAEGLSGKFMR
ncbi:hypothetical protein [Paraburkholderia sp. MM5384-R2]|uniref:hypothetical protein n=1 Tax=Paraburkholderia sp. MM5384-R2 TaxID=2723097 RepID=UPI00161872DF|nr:hypothetical protein [Paraburkholderia sp. MM5384-R2]MBB5503132.1 hypothetical protein [Paraburkholderia sp. MM5384-R2]